MGWGCVSPGAWWWLLRQRCMHACTQTTQATSQIQQERRGNVRSWYTLFLLFVCLDSNKFIIFLSNLHHIDNHPSSSHPTTPLSILNLLHHPTRRVIAWNLGSYPPTRPPRGQIRQGFIPPHPPTQPSPPRLRLPVPPHPRPSLRKHSWVDFQPILLCLRPPPTHPPFSPSFPDPFLHLPPEAGGEFDFGGGGKRRRRRRKWGRGRRGRRRGGRGGGGGDRGGDRGVDGAVQGLTQRAELVGGGGGGGFGGEEGRGGGDRGGRQSAFLLGLFLFFRSRGGGGGRGKDGGFLLLLLLLLLFLPVSFGALKDFHAGAPAHLLGHLGWGGWVGGWLSWVEGDSWLRWVGGWVGGLPARVCGGARRRRGWWGLRLLGRDVRERAGGRYPLLRTGRSSQTCFEGGWVGGWVG